MFSDFFSFLKSIFGFGVDDNVGCCGGQEGCSNDSGDVLDEEDELVLDVDSEVLIIPDGLPDETNLLAMTNAQLHQLAEYRGVAVLKKDVKSVLVDKILQAV